MTTYSNGEFVENTLDSLNNEIWKMVELKSRKVHIQVSPTRMKKKFMKWWMKRVDKEVEKESINESEKSEIKNCGVKNAKEVKKK